ncbi:sulfatase-like hydrolase/transferase [uncultured Microscilla sp.]|uniref:sulfatase-like hydrolase/transferase n=1 Tax=uncultured Microscilla sp. TaxID=432653 RepID=UPI002626F5EC|nr:sulfatase-like hydrolase/transferase [uncultured Microscilla sp.]
MRKNTLFLVIMLTFALGSCKKSDPVTTDPTTGNRPNILLIIADDIGIEATPGYSIGAIKPSMPNLQKLAATGITFDNAWAYPVCSPTRASILTGRYGYRTEVLNATNAAQISTTETSIQKYLDANTANAYSHAVIGKWHLSNSALNPGQMGVGYYAGLLKGALTDYNEWPLVENEQETTYQGYCTTKFTDLAIDWIKQQNKPWFCWLAYTAPHTPFHLPPTGLHSQGALPNNQASIDANPTPYFMAMTESIDFEIGRLLNSISPDELENALIIFLGDNGSHRQVIQAPYAATQAKGTLYQGGIHVPLIVSGKGVSRAGERESSLISTTDFFATIAEIAGVPLPTYQDSYSFQPLLTSNTTGTRIYNYSEVLTTSSADKSGYAIRNTQYKLIVFDSGQKQLYDLVNDPYEKNDLTEGGVLTTEQSTALAELENKAGEIRK